MMISSNIKGSISITPTSNSIHLLLKLASPQVIIHIGAGTGNGGMHQWRQWDIPHALIIDADRDRLNWTKPLIAKNPGWHAVSAILAETEGEMDFYQASNPEEDSLIPPQRMNSLWPGLRTTAQDLRPTRSLEHLLAEDCSVTFNEADPIWVFVDCLPALPILKGAGAHIDSWSVLWLRVLLQYTDGIDECVTLESTQDFLHPQGFRCIDVMESNHPAVGYALFVRDWLAILQPRIETLEQANIILAKEKLALTARQDTLKQAVTALTQTRNKQDQLAAKYQAKIEALIQERDNYANQARNEQTLMVTQHRAELEQLQFQLQQSGIRIAQLKSELAGSDNRQQLLNKEIIKAEAQIELIKDVLLREPGL